jgi:P-type E1-E2 ATPase
MVVEGAYSYFRYLLLMGTMIPISLIVSLECCKLVQSSYIIHDVKMFTLEPNRENRMARVVQTNIVEELGQVSYVFSDKTGTLTRNEMTFKALCIGGRQLVEASNEVKLSRRFSKL